ncbi:UEV domain-containing protein [Fimicolochytrium jonesii]|uniref:UEV domain-containing protein n=1 Tax=Fimicolochytrium jonesii TaxID=1396493 RepID=UPI0022FEEDBB|nr:UEV domain-containing protein [Fimicolochytrium jonesii]KAI8820138.1 UEV domain-containing protein [Fimicolochytrium jonesii]
MTYHSRERVFRDADSVLVTYNGLAPKTDTYTHEDGRTLVLLCLHGTIPIKFRNVTYNIPIAAWVPYAYPTQPPICFVTPTSSMLVRASKHVDLSGKIYHPYLAYWHMNTEESNLLTFMHVLQDIFAAEPPVYTKPSNAAPTPQQPPAQTGQNYGPPGYSASPTPSNPNVGSQQSGYPPQRPQQHPQQQQQQMYTQHPPSHPQQQQQQQQQYQNQNPALPPQVLMPDPRRHTTPPPSQHTQQQPPPIPPPPAYPTSRDGSPHPTRLPHTPPPPLPHKPLAATLDGQAYQHATDERAQKLQNAKEAVRVKLREKEREFQNQVPPEIERLLHVNRKLGEGARRVEDSLVRSAEREQEIKQTIESLKTQNETTAQHLTELRAQPDANVDELLVPPTVVHKQLMDLVAEDHAIDDTLYYLAKALDAERVELNAYMKAVRTLAREQFMKRALVGKVRGVLG